MLYRVIKVFANLAIKIFCRNIAINKKELLKINGPLLIASNHPNSFLDAIIFCILFNKPVYSLARGDAFKNKFFANILFKLKMFPVYRVSEGVENLEENYKTFDICKKLFKQNCIVLIFSEGLCVNEWHLRPLKKGTARLTISSWQDGIPLKVLPVGVNYSSFKKFGKNVALFLGNFITANDIDSNCEYGKNIKTFNTSLYQQLQSLVFEIDKNDKQKLIDTFYIQQSIFKKITLFIPAILGWLFNAPLFYPIKLLANKFFANTGHYDSVVVGILFLTYPIYLILVTLLLYTITHNWFCIFILIALPFTAWSYVQLKSQLD